MSTKIDDLTITKGSGTVLTLKAKGKYVSDDSFFNINVQNGAGAVTISSASSDILSDASGRNISGVIGNKTSQQPASGYYIKVEADSTGEATITAPGWLNTGSLGIASGSDVAFYPVQEGTADVSGTNTVTPSASISGSGVTLSNTNNGISVTAVGGGSAEATVSAVAQISGYIDSGDTLDSATVSSDSASTSVSSYISGVTLAAPSSGTNSFSITVPNGDSTITFTYIVDASGNVYVE